MPVVKSKKKRKENNEVVDGEVVEQETQNEIQEEVFQDEEMEMPSERRDPKYSEFKFKRLAMNEGGQWELHLEIAKSFEKFYMNYVVEFTVDLDTLDWRIEEKKKAKANYEAQNQMDAFEDMKKRELEAYDQRIEALMNERAERVSQSPKISFEAEVVSFKKSLPAKVVFLIPGTVINELNEKRNMMDNYKIELIKNLNNE